MRRWLRNWLGITDQPRGTLTLFDSTTVLGLPFGDWNRDEIAEMRANVEEWRHGGFTAAGLASSVIVLPFPVNVIDMRFGKIAVLGPRGMLHGSDDRRDRAPDADDE